MLWIEHWLPNFLNMDTKGGHVKLEKAHCSLAPKPGSDQQLRPITIRFYSFPYKQKVNGDITLEGRKISYHDLSAAVLWKQKEFNEAK